MISRNTIVSRRRLGTSIPTVGRPGIRSIRTFSASNESASSSASPVIRLILMPALGRNSKVVTTGPGWIVTCPRHRIRRTAPRSGGPDGPTPAGPQVVAHWGRSSIRSGEVWRGRGPGDRRGRTACRVSARSGGTAEEKVVPPRPAVPPPWRECPQPGGGTVRVGDWTTAGFSFAAVRRPRNGQRGTRNNKARRLRRLPRRIKTGLGG